MRTLPLGTSARLLILTALPLVACSYEDTAVIDTIAPKIGSISPADMAENVPVNAGIELRFSEPMDGAAGRIVASPGGTFEVSRGAWDSTGQRFGLRPATPWPSDASITLRIEGFRDRAGNEAPALEVRFRTAGEADTVAPFTVSSVPTEGASGISPDITSITLTFSEPMSQTSGSVSLEGPSGALGPLTWASAQSLSIPVSGLLAAASYAVALSGFSDLAGNVLDPAPHLGDGKLDFATGAVADTTRPTVLSSTPLEGDSDVATPLGAVVLRFSEPMRTGTGTAALYVGGSTAGVALTAAWSGSSDVLSFDVTGLVAPSTTYRITLEAYRDLAGNLLDGTPYLLDGALDFQTGDDLDTTPPQAVGSNPAEGAVDVPVGLTELSISFNEAMNPLVVTATLSGGSGGPETLLGVFSAANTVVTFDVTGLLELDQSYRLDVSRFEDAAGNRLDGAPYLLDGALDFDSAVTLDTVAPTVVTSSPAEASLLSEPPDVIILTFSEPMRTSSGAAALIGPSATTVLTNAWSAGGTILTLDCAGLTDYASAYRVTFTGFADLAGNALDTTPYLANGELDFAVEAEPDTTRPRVTALVPTEGAVNVDPALGAIVVTFDEAMDASVTQAAFTGGSLNTNLSAVWSSGDTVATFSLGSVTLELDTAYRLDLRAFTDLAGNSLDPAPLITDGYLDFQTSGVPSGESCSDVLTTAFATSQSGGLYTFDIAPQSVTATDGSFGCDPDGAGRDLVIQFDKTAPDTAAGAAGRLLAVRVLSDDPGQALNVEILSGECDAANPSAVQRKCVYGRPDWGAYADVPAGRYWIWVSAAGTGADFPGATIEIEEVAVQAAEGEGCWLPYSAGSVVHTAPGAATDPHVFEIPANAIRAFDISETWGEPDALSCVNDPVLGDNHGADAVIAFVKQDASSTLLVEATALDGTTPIHIEAFSDCAPGAVGRSAYACAANDPSVSLAFSTAPADTVYFWLAADRQTTGWPGARVEIREQTVDAGETCANAQVILAPGAINLSKVSNDRFDAPSCFTTLGPIDWYRYTVTEANVRIFANLAGELGVINAANGNELGCFDDAASLGFAANITPGTTLCLAVPSNAATTQLTILDPGDEYDGVGTTVTPLALSSTPAWTGERWLAASPTRLYVGLEDRIFEVGKTSTVALLRDAADGVSAAVLGYGGVALDDESLFVLDDRATVDESRLTRLFDGLSFANTVWDPTPTYVAQSARALGFDGASFIYATSEAGSTTLYMRNTGAPAAPVQVGSHDAIGLVSGLAADDTYLYLAGLGPEGEGIYRLAVAGLGTPNGRLEPLAVGVDLDLAGSVSVQLDAASNASYLYFRTRDPSTVQAIAAPASPAPLHVGVISTLGAAGDRGMVFDRGENALYLFETETDAAGRLVRIE